MRGVSVTIALFEPDLRAKKAFLDGENVTMLRGKCHDNAGEMSPKCGGNVTLGILLIIRKLRK